MQRRATANPSTDGIAASHRQRAAPAVSTRKPSQPGRSQNHRAKNAKPTASEPNKVSHCSAPVLLGSCPDCAVVMVAPVANIILRQFAQDKPVKPNHVM